MGSLFSSKAQEQEGLSAAEVKAVQESWAIVQTVGGSDGHAVTKAIFYPHLTSNAEVAALFANVDMDKQSTALWNMLGQAVNGLSDLKTLVPVLKDLGKRHVKYGVKEAHYDNVGESLIYTLKTGLGDAFTLELRMAWVKVYGIIANTMKEGARELPLSAEEVEAVQKSWAAVQTVGGSDGHAVTRAIFYPHLLEDAEVAALFAKVPMDKQSTALWNMLGKAVDGLSDLDALAPLLKDLGKRHVNYGVKEAHYDNVGASLIYTLKTGLGDSFTPELEATWIKVYGIIATTMKAGAKDAAQ